MISKFNGYTIFHKFSRPVDCSVIDESWLGENATRVDLLRFWTAFETISSNRWLMEDLRISPDHPEDWGHEIDAWLWNQGDYGSRLDQIIGEVSE